MIKNFDLTGWVCFSDRRNSRSYYSADKKWMVKFDSEMMTRTKEDLEKERQISINAIEIGIKTPKVSDVVSLQDGTLGLIFEYVEGKKSIARALGEDIDNLEMYMKKFAIAGKDFHSKICDTNKFESIAERIRKNMINSNYLNETQLKVALEFLDNVEVKNTCLHGDFHMGNFITTGTEEFAIDLGAIGYGNPVWDVSTLYYFTHYLPSEVIESAFHCDKKYGKDIWKYFVKYYYGIDDEKGLEKISKDFEKYSMVGFFQILNWTNPGPIVKDNIDKHFNMVFSL